MNNTYRNIVTRKYPTSSTPQNTPLTHNVLENCSEFDRLTSLVDSDAAFSSGLNRIELPLEQAPALVSRPRLINDISTRNSEYTKTLDSISVDPSLLVDSIEYETLRKSGKNKESQALFNNIFEGIRLYGYNHALFHTYTFRENPNADFAAARKKISGFIEKHISPRYNGAYVCVVELGEKGGRMHFHLLTYTTWDTEPSAFPWHEVGGGPAGQLPPGQHAYFGNVPTRMHEEIHWQRALTQEAGNEFGVGRSQVRPLWVPRALAGSAVDKLSLSPDERAAWLAAAYVTKYMRKGTVIQIVDKRRFKAGFKRTKKEFENTIGSIQRSNMSISSSSPRTRASLSSVLHSPHIVSAATRQRELRTRIRDLSFHRLSPEQETEKKAALAELKQVQNILSSAPTYVRAVVQRRESLHDYRNPALHTFAHAKKFQVATQDLLRVAGVPDSEMPDTASKLKKLTASITKEHYRAAITSAEHHGFSFGSAQNAVKSRGVRLWLAVSFLHRTHNASAIHDAIYWFLRCRHLTTKKPLVRFRFMKVCTFGQAWGKDIHGNIMENRMSSKFMHFATPDEDGTLRGGFEFRQRRRIYTDFWLKITGFDVDIDDCDMPELQTLFNKRVFYQHHGLIMGYGSVTAAWVIEDIQDKFSKYNPSDTLKETFLTFIFENYKAGEEEREQHKALFSTLVSDESCDVAEYFRKKEKDADCVFR